VINLTLSSSKILVVNFHIGHVLISLPNRNEVNYIMRGFVYVLSNTSMPGLLKVGYTTRSIEERINELCSTGVPTRFFVEFFCEVDNALLLEKNKHHYGKEFFNCKIEIVVCFLKLELIESNYEIHDIGGRSSSAFLTENELENIRKEQEARVNGDKFSMGLPVYS